jgi:hypothetical protein
MTTALEMIPAIGATVLVRFEQLQILCTVLNVKNSWGKPRLLITPDSRNSTGQQWVELERVTVPATEKPKSTAEEVASMRRAIQSIL